MTPDERQLIADLFDRLRSSGDVDKDREAEGFIAQQIMATPDAAYKLVQTVLVHENTLGDAQARIDELEEQIQQMQGQGRPQQAPQGGGFLGGVFGGRQQSTAVPQAGHRSSGFGQSPAPQQMQPQASSPWNRQPAQPQGGFQQPMQQQQPVQQASSGGGFFRGALGMAAGVAGGVLAANAIGSMFGGSKSSDAQAGTPAAGGDVSGYDVNANSGGAAEQDYNYQSEDDNDPGNSDGGSWGGDDGSSL